MRTTTDTFDCGTVQLQRGGTLKGAKIVYKTFGTLSPRRDNVIVYPTSYSAHHTDIEWLVDVRHGLDPSRYFIVIPNMFTNGLSTSPSNYDGEFPQVTAYDNVVQQRRLMNEVFGVERIKMVYGWSMGAQQAYHWAALFGASVERIVVNCGSARTAPHNFVFLEGVRTAVQNARTPQDGLKAMGRIYAGWALSQTFYRREMWRGLGFGSLHRALPGHDLQVERQAGLGGHQAQQIHAEALGDVLLVQVVQRRQVLRDAQQHRLLTCGMGEARQHGGEGKAGTASHGGG